MSAPTQDDVIVARRIVRLLETLGLRGERAVGEVAKVIAEVRVTITSDKPGISDG